jgi:hypothetical protein
MVKALNDHERKHLALMYSRCGFPIPAHLLPPPPQTMARHEKETDHDQEAVTW